MRSAKCEMQKNAKCDASLCPSPTILLSFLPLSIRRLGSPPFHPVSVSARHSYFSASSMLSLSARHLLQLRLITIHSRVKGGGTLLLVMVLVLLLVQNIKYTYRSRKKKFGSSQLHGFTGIRARVRKKTRILKFYSDNP